MLRNEIIFFHNNFMTNFPDLFEVYQVTSPKNLGYSEVLKVDLVYLQVDHINAQNQITFRDAGGKLISTYCILDEWTKIGDRCLVPISFKRFGRQGIYAVTGVGYQKVSPGPLDYVNNMKISESILIGSRYVKLTDRYLFTLVDEDSELPDEFFDLYRLDRREKVEEEIETPEAVKDYLDSLGLFDYDAKYKISEELEYDPSTNKSRKPQSFDSRQSKIYIMSKDMKTILKKTNALVADHKSKQFGMDSLEFRALENKKIFDLLEQEGYSKDEVCFARKEIGLIRACIDHENKIEVRARFGEINIDDHKFRNDTRYLQNGDIIEMDENGIWWFVDKEDND